MYKLRGADKSTSGNTLWIIHHLFMLDKNAGTKRNLEGISPYLRLVGIHLIRWVLTFYVL